MCSAVKKCGTYGTEVLERDDGGCYSQGGKKGGSSFRGNFGKRNLHHEHGGYELPRSHHQQDDGNVEMRDVHEDPPVRHTPYTIRRNRRRVKWHSEDQIHITVWRDRKPPERAVGENTRDRTMGSWFKVTIPYGRTYDKTWLMNSIQSHCSVPFTPVDFHYVKNRARFFVQDASTASALKDVSYNICDEENRKISIFVSPSAAPYSVQNKLKPEQMQQLKLTMNKRYDVSQQALDLQKLRFDPDLVGCDMDIILNRRNCMAATLQIIERNFPELLSLNLRNNKLYRLDGLSDIIEKAPKVKILNLSRNELKSAWELGKVKGLKLEELWLEGNPLCSTFPDQSAYVSAIRDCFPELLRLDGQDIPPPIITDIDVPQLIKPCQESHNGFEILKSLVLQFLQQYYLIFDYGDRQGLLDAYHEEACFSLTIPFNPEDPASSSLREYFKESRNMKILKDPHVRRQLLKHTKRDIVDSLSVLPKTQHDLSSFLVDMWFQTERMLCFSVNGVFKEVEGKCQGSVLAFTRTFIATPGSNSSLCIVNDELFVRDTSSKETQSTFSIPMSTPCSSSVPALSQEQQEMVQAFSSQSGMKLEWSQKCLQDNEWNYTRAGQIFTLLQAEGKIPEEAFQQTP
ncbi:nuclear RNA export factor 2 [Daubentonia madagascariensis]|uniref:Nuclear RNA export factor 2 n=1 Tax=Daubentonia madagascariensis TaxID=31869 RepID=A0ABD2D393_DAUMA